MYGTGTTSNGRAASRPLDGGFTKHDAGKAPWALIGPFRGPLEQVSHVARYGSKKYARDNWRLCDDPERYYDAAQRHLWAWADGERTDPESGLPHLAHAAWCVLALLWFETRKEKTDESDTLDRKSVV